MADILLAHSNHLYSDPKQVAKMQPYPPLQTILAAALLEQQGFSTAVFDPALEQSPREAFAIALARHRPRLLCVCEDDFNFLSKMCLTRNRELAFFMAQAAAARGIAAIVHGSDASDHTAAYLDAGFAAVILGEPEATLLEYAQQRDPLHINGLALRRGSLLHQTAPRKLRTDLDTLPLPAWHLVDIERYRRAWLGAHGYFSLNLASSRGCPYRCNWCAKPIYGHHYHVHSPQRVVAELAELKRSFRPDHIWFADDIFALSPRWTREFADAVESRSVRTPFKMQSRCDLMTRDAVADLRRAGCAEVWMGAESGSQRILDAMDKQLRVEEVLAACAHLRNHSMRACLFLQFGYPGETWEDIEATVRMVRAAQPEDVGVSISYPLPGTKLHQIVRAGIGAKANWNDSADLAMIFHGEFSTPFYRALAAAVHAEVRASRSAGSADSVSAWKQVEELRFPRAEMAAV